MPKNSSGVDLVESIQSDVAPKDGPSSGILHLSHWQYPKLHCSHTGRPHLSSHFTKAFLWMLWGKSCPLNTVNFYPGWCEKVFEINWQTSLWRMKNQTHRYHSHHLAFQTDFKSLLLTDVYTSHMLTPLELFSVQSLTSIPAAYWRYL